jgi:hypothetical protein
LEAIIAEDPGTTCVAVILRGASGRESFQHTIMANNEVHAIEKASGMAKRM